MKSSHRRISRALVMGVGAVIALGLVFWAGKLSGGKSSPSKPEPNRAAAPIDPGTPKSDAKLASATTLPSSTLETPTVASTQPSSIALASAATQPTGSLMLAAAQSATTRPTLQGNAQLADHKAAAPAVAGGPPLVDAKAKMDAGKLLDARKVLNASLVSGSLSPTDAAAAKQMLNKINATVVFSSQRFADDEFGGSFNVPPGAVLAKIANSHEVTPDLLMRINGISDPRRLRAGQTLKVVTGPFNALVNKSQFTLELWLGEPNGKGSMYITSFPVGLGKDDSTPAGVWAIKNKLKNPAYYSPRGQGVIAADDPKNPLGEYWIGLEGTDGHAVGKTSYGIHGTIDPNSIGKQESMGCIRLKNEDVGQVFEMLVEGKSTVTVQD
jgi:lipoprotein-anchoring transpeptidase ErfK/SrfK